MPIPPLYAPLTSWMLADHALPRREPQAVCACEVCKLGADVARAVPPPTTDHYRPAVARGAGFLDRVLTEPWRPRIDVASLHIADTECCVLGQLYGEYGHGLTVLRLSTRHALEFGFRISSAHTVVGGIRAEYSAYDALTRAWRDELAPA